MYEFFRCLAESACEVGLRALLEDVPGGKFVCGVAEKTLEKFRQQVQESKHRGKIEVIAKANFEQTGEVRGDGGG